MSHYWDNFKNFFYDINPSTYRGGELNFFNAGKNKYKANQANKDQPFEEGYIESSDVYSITNKIARNARVIPLRVEIHTDDEIEIINKGQLFDLVNQPNKHQSKEDFTEEGMNHLLVGGNSFFIPLIPVGFTTASEVNMLHPQLIEIVPKREGKFFVPKEYIYRIDGQEFHIEPEQVTHMKYVNPSRFGINTLYGLSPLVAGYLTVQGLVKNQTASTSVFDNHGKTGIISSENEEYPMTPEQRDEQQKLLDLALGGAHQAGGIHQSGVKIKYHRLDLDPTQMRLIEGKVLTMRDLCNIYDVQSTLFNDPTNRIQNNVEPSGSMFWTNAVKPNLDKYVASYNRSVVTGFNLQDFPSGESKYVVRADYSGVEALQSDKKKEAEKDKLVMEGIQIILGWPLTIDAKKLAIKENYDVSDEFVDSIVEFIPENNP